MKESLTKLLDRIGQETHNDAYVDSHGTIRPISKDEALVREIWKRALGWEENIINADKTVLHRVHSPDPKMQQFIIERREGKFVTPTDDQGAKLLDRIEELAKLKINKMAEDTVNDRNAE